MEKKMNIIPSLDGIRVIAVFVIILAHAGISVLPGGFGVLILFFLSGYLITTRLRWEIETTGNIALKQYFLKRSLRIWPTFYFIFVLGIILTLLQVLSIPLTFNGLFFQGLNLANIYKIIFGDSGVAEGTGVFWSLAIGQHFYIVFPLLLVFFRFKEFSNKKMAIILLVINLIILLWRCMLVYHLHAPHNRTYYGTDTRIDNLFYGCILGMIFNPVMDLEKEKIKPIYLYISLVLSILIILFSLVYRSEYFRETFRYTLQSIALIPWFITAITYHDRSLFRLFNTNAVQYLGSLMFSAYLVHFTVTLTLNRYFGTLPLLLRVILTLLISVALGAIIRTLIEEPVRKIKVRYFSK
jgi:peptidoglycan/LPS O-acetylase OafA/YrhL